MRYVFRPDGHGHFKAVPTRGKVKLYRHDDVHLPFEQQMLKAHYQLECEQGSRFNPSHGEHSAQTIKQAWGREN